MTKCYVSWLEGKPETFRVARTRIGREANNVWLGWANIFSGDLRRVISATDYDLPKLVARSINEVEAILAEYRKRKASKHSEE